MTETSGFGGDTGPEDRFPDPGDDLGTYSSLDGDGLDPHPPQGPDDAPAVAPQPDAAAAEPEEDDPGDLEVWFATDWVDPGVLPDSPDEGHELPRAGFDEAARLLWDRAHPGIPAPEEDTAALLGRLTGGAFDDLDERAARILLDLLDHTSAAE